LFGESLIKLVEIEEATGDGDLADLCARVSGFFEQVPKLVFVQETEVDKDLTEFAATA
jgi:hypothetical protein